MITCYVRYVLDMEKLDAFAEYGRLWIKLINKLGGQHHGYFLPNLDTKAKSHGRFSFSGIGSEGPTNIGIAVFSFPDWAVYERYRAEAQNYDECKKATKIVETTSCFTSYERNFMTPILSDTNENQEKEFVEIIKSDQWLMGLLKVGQSLGLEDESERLR